MDPSTRFDDAQVRKILARAADRQEQADRALPASRDPAGPPAPGLSLVEIQEAAVEVGIDPDHVRAAARELQLRDETAVARYPFLAIPREVVERRVIPGALTEAEWERIVGELRSEFRVPGVINAFGDVREWWSTSGAGSAYPIGVRVEPGEDGTEIAIRRSARQWSEGVHAAGWSFASLAAALGVLFSVGSFDPGAVAAPVLLGGLSAGTFAAGRIMAPRWVRRTRARFSALLDRVELSALKGRRPPEALPGG